MSSQYVLIRGTRGNDQRLYDGNAIEFEASPDGRVEVAQLSRAFGRRVNLLPDKVLITPELDGLSNVSFPLGQRSEVVCSAPPQHAVFEPALPLAFVEFHSQACGE
jgi:hypothetical protein